MVTKDAVKSAKTTMEILGNIRDLEGATLTEVANKTGKNKSTVYNYLTTLEENGYLVKSNGDYDISAQFLSFGDYISKNMDIYEIGRTEVVDLAEKTGQTVHLAIEENGFAIIIHVERGEQGIHLDTHQGMRLYLHNTALGKAILAYLAVEQRQQIIQRNGLPASTDNTITKKEQLVKELNQIRDEGIAYDHEERVSGVLATAAPILNDNDSVTGAISISGPKTQFSDQDIKKNFPDLLRHSSNVISINERFI